MTSPGAPSFAHALAPKRRSGRLGRYRKRHSSPLARAATTASRAAHSTSLSLATEAIQPLILLTVNVLFAATASPHASPRPWRTLKQNSSAGTTKPALTKPACPDKGSNVVSAVTFATAAPSASHLALAAALCPRSIWKHALVVAPVSRLARSLLSALASHSPR